MPRTLGLDAQQWRHVAFAALGIGVVAWAWYEHTQRQNTSSQPAGTDLSQVQGGLPALPAVGGGGGAVNPVAPIQPAAGGVSSSTAASDPFAMLLEDILAGQIAQALGGAAQPESGESPSASTTNLAGLASANPNAAGSAGSLSGTFGALGPNWANAQIVTVGGTRYYTPSGLGTAGQSVPGINAGTGQFYSLATDAKGNTTATQSTGSVNLPGGA